MHSIIEFKMMVLEELLRVLSPNRRVFVLASLDSEMLQSCSEGSLFHLCR